MNIRRLTAADADALYGLRLHALQSDPRGFRESHEELQNVAVATYAQRLGDVTDDTFVLGAFADNETIGCELIGMVGFYREQALKCRHKGWIWGMFVMPNHRGRGVGRALLAAAIERARKIAGLAVIRLSVSTTQDAARGLYQGCGFRVTCREAQAMIVDGVFIDEEQMTLSL
jgi:ribosomal protein S18 acetylase RimI-like enzyme